MAYIDRELMFAKIKEKAMTKFDWSEQIDVDDFEEVIKELPTADVVVVKHGEWILHNDGSGTCKVCGRHQKNIWDMCAWQKYCGHCGAKMNGGKEE